MRDLWARQEAGHTKGATLTETLREMNFQVNWATTANEGESHGTWMPFNLSTGEPFRDGWTTCMGTPDFASCECSNGRLGLVTVPRL